MVALEKPFKKVVLVDDSEIDNMIHKSLIERNQFAEEISEFSDSVAALKAVQKVASSKDKTGVPDFIFLDIAMPVMDSYKFLDEYEKLDKDITAACKVIILTSSINPKDRKESLKRKSVSGYLTKPLTKKALCSLGN